MTAANCLILASQSPRRAELLRQIGVAFEVIKLDVPEVREPGETPAAYVARLARTKSAAGAVLHPHRPVLGADTLVVCGDNVLEKPRDQEQGVAMLLSLSDRSHKVMTAVAITQDDRQRVLTNTTEVVFRQISEQEAIAYWRTGEPCDKAGGYGIQGYGAVFVATLQGSYSSVVGLPLFETQTLLTEFAVPFWATALSEE